MARKPTINGTRGHNVANGSDAPPPSTITAQIVHNHAQANRQQQPQVKATFAQLLSEIRNDPSALEEDLESNWRLISVISEAAFDTVIRDDPFAQQDEQILQAIASLDVIEIVVKRVADVLFYNGQGTEGPGSELFLWLPSKVVYVASLLLSEDFNHRTEALLSSLGRELSHSPFKVKSSLKLVLTYQCCTNDILDAMETASLPPFSELKCPVPSLATRSRFSPESQTSIALPSKFQTSIRSLDEAAVCVSMWSRIILKVHYPFESMDLSVIVWYTAIVSRLLTLLKRLKSKLSHTALAQCLGSVLDIWSELLGRCSNPASNHRERVFWTAGFDVFSYLLTQDISLMPTAFAACLTNCISKLRGLLTKLPLCDLDALFALTPSMRANFMHSEPESQDRFELSNELELFLEQIEATTSKQEHNTTMDIDQSQDTSQSRPVLLAEEAPSSPAIALRSFCLLMGNWDVRRLERLPASAIGLFVDLDEQSKKKALRHLAHASRNGPDTEVFGYGGKDRVSQECLHLSAILETFISSEEITRHRNLKFLLLQAVMSYLEHTLIDDHMNLDISNLGKWALKNLKSSEREIRLFAVDFVSIVVRRDRASSTEVSHRNLAYLIHFLRQMSASKNARYNEVAIHAVGRFVLHCPNDMIHLGLQDLVTALGHTNQLLHGMAQVEISQVAQELDTSVEELFRPHWGIVAWHVLKEFPSKPQRVQLMAELMSTTVNKFLMVLEKYTLPHLIVSGRRDILKRLALAHGSNTSVWDICMDPQNRTCILAYMVAQDPEDLETSLKHSLQRVCPDFEHEDIASLLKLDPSAVACEILKYAGDGPGRRDKILHGFRAFTVIIERKNHLTSTDITKDRMCSLFFESSSLGIMTAFAQTIENVSSPVLEKRRCLRGLSAMIAMAQTSLNGALMQIRSCLQAALEVPQLVDAAVDAWCGLVYVQRAEDDQEDVMTLVAQLFATLTKHWDSLEQDTQRHAYNVVGSVLKTHSQFIQAYPETLPSLSSIQIMSKHEAEIARLKAGGGIATMLAGFAERCRDESASVVLQALYELGPFLQREQRWLHESTLSEQPDPVISDLLRSLLDLCSAPKDSREILLLSSQCLGTIGSLDASKIDVHREQNDMLMLSNFEQGSEIVQFIASLLQHKLVKIFQSMSNPRAQGFLAYAMQELLKFGGFRKEKAGPARPTGSADDEIHQAWIAMSDSVRSSLEPLLSSHYVLTVQAQKKQDPLMYPFWTTSMSHGLWLRSVVTDLLQRANGDHAKQLFGTLSRIIRYDIAIARFVFPFAAANIIIGGTEDDVAGLSFEFLKVLEEPMEGKNSEEVDTLKRCSEDVLQVLDYLSRWLAEKRKHISAVKNQAGRGGQAKNDFQEVTDNAQRKSVERIFLAIPADVMSKRAVDCGSYAMALLHWEEHIRQKKGQTVFEPENDEDDALLQRLQEIYSQIDELDGVEGILTHMRDLTSEQQVMEHRKAGRWAAAQSWYDLKLVEEPLNSELQADLLTCLRDSGQLNGLLDKCRAFPKPLSGKVLSIATEAAWNMQRWNDLSDLLGSADLSASHEFNPTLGQALIFISHGMIDEAQSLLTSLQVAVGASMSLSTTSSLQACHDQMLKLHALHEVTSVLRAKSPTPETRIELQKTFARRLNILGSNTLDKQYLLGIRRAALYAMRDTFNRYDIRPLWMETLTLARKNDQPNIAYDAVLHAWQLGEASAKIEEARLVWKAGSHRKAIQSLQLILESHILEHDETVAQLEHPNTRSSVAVTAPGTTVARAPNMAVARAHVLLAKWIDRASQSTMAEVNSQYQLATKAFSRWEKGLYHLGKFYLKIHESERSLPWPKQTARNLSGETAKLCIENYLRSLCFGRKYMFQTLPKLLTLWLDFGQEIDHEIPKAVPQDVRERALAHRKVMLGVMNSQVKKYTVKIPSWIFYTALAQMISRLGHKNQEVYDNLFAIIARVVTSHPQQGLWSLFAVMKSTLVERSKRGYALVNKVRERKSDAKNEGSNLDVKNLIIQGQKLAESLLQASDISMDGKSSTISLARDLRFNTRLAPCALVVPMAKALSASLPSITEHGSVRSHRAFPLTRDAITIAGFTDQVLVLQSLQKPRRITVIGSDGKKYGLLCKPNDDLRKDQRLMEFQSMINRGLKAYAPAAKRRLYIKTYAVTPLNESCGVIEWVDGLKAMRDVLLYHYRAKGMRIDYNIMKLLLEEACDNNDPRVFTDKILPMYKPALHEWFTATFPASESWFAARQRYSRSCAVASMVGYVLGLGDRHGENVLLEESSGGVFHVDFNCLFDKGQTFDKPEMVPFRLTHNMVDAFGPSGVEGPFRTAAELTCRIMRVNLDALLTILETFVYDPTSDLLSTSTRKKSVKGVPETPKEILDSVRGKVLGHYRGDALPLGVEGLVDMLVRTASDPANLMRMYIGWCAFL